MSRDDARVLVVINNIEKTEQRAAYPEDLVTLGVLAKGSCKARLEALRDNDFLKEESEHGANVYRITNKGIYGVQAYRDLAYLLKKEA